MIGNDKLNVTRNFDLKGSITNRKVKITPEQIIKGTGLKCLKCENFREFVSSPDAEGKINMDFMKKQELIERIEQDSLFLQKHNLMDYSLLFM